MASNFLRTEALTHAQKICRFYKKASRVLQGKNPDIAQWRYEATILRAEFDKNKNLGHQEAKQAFAMGEQTLYKLDDPFPFKFPTSVGGTGYGRDPPHPDNLLDGWHPLEKAQYPSYFATRDIRKREFIERYEQKYGTAKK